MDINNAGQLPRPNFLGPKTTAGTKDGKIGSQSAGIKIDANTAESLLIKRLNVSSVKSRESLLSEVKSKLQSGEFLTRNQAEATANAIVDL